MDMPYSSKPLIAFRTAQIESAGGIRSLRAGNWEMLGALNIFPGQPLRELVFIIPKGLVPPGNQSKLAQRKIDGTLGGELTRGASQDAAERRREWLGRSFLAFWLPTGSKRGNGLQAWSYRKRCIDLLWILRACIPTMKPNDGDFWPYVLAHRANDFAAISQSERAIFDMNLAVEILISAASTGLLAPPPAPLTSKPRREVEEGYPEERSKMATSSRTADVKKKPFPDGFVTEFLSRAFWIQDNIAPAIIEFWREMDARQRKGALNAEQLRPVRRRMLADFDWRDANGDLIVELPFPLKQRCDEGGYEYSFRWPPRHFSTIRLLLGVIQISNLCTVAFCTAARTHELQGMDCDTDGLAQKGFVEGRTFKNTGRAQGRKRDWPLHPRAARALALQEQLAQLVRPDAENHLWVTFKDGEGPVGSPLTSLSGACVKVIGHLDLSDLAEGRPHMHRWRHTVARLIGLAAEKGAEVLMDLLGTSLDSVLVYLLSDPEITSEAIRIAEEVTYALAEEAIKQTEKGTSGGPASAAIGQGLDNLKMRRGIRELGTDDIDTAVHQLTASGTAFQVVRRGVICTKQLGEYGPCTKTLGRADKGSCRPTCVHRLELAAEKEQCFKQIEMILEMIVKAIAAGRTMVVEHLKGQFIYEMERWDEVRSKIFARHSLALELWDESSV